MESGSREQTGSRLGSETSELDHSSHPLRKILSLKDTTTSPNSVTIWMPSIQTLEPEGDISHSKHNMRTLVRVDERPLS